MVIINFGLGGGHNPDRLSTSKSIRSDITRVFMSHARGARPVAK